MSAPVRCRTAASIVVAMTDLLGHRPVDSLVILPMQGNESIAILRVDLPVASVRADDDRLQEYVVRAIGMLLRVDGITGITAVAFSNGTGASAAHADVLAMLVRVARRVGLGVGFLGFLAADRWGTVDVDTPTCIRRRPLEELGELALRPAAPVLPNLGTRITVAPVADEAAPRLDTLGDERVLDLLVDSPNPAVHPDDLADVDTRVAAAFASESRLPALIARIAFGDAFADLDRVWSEVLDDAAPLDPLTDRLREAFDPDRCERAIVVLESSSEVAAEHELPNVHAVLGWLCWAVGRGTQSGAWCGKVLEARASHALAETVDALLAAAVVPSWFGKPPARARAPRAAA